MYRYCLKNVFRLLAFLKQGGLSDNIDFRLSATRKSFGMKFDPAAVSKTLFSGGILLAVRPT